MYMRTIHDQLSATDNHPSGFDHIRILLAVAVIAWHGLFVCYGPASETPFWTGPLRPIVYAGVPSFFALSGFLVAGSLERNDLASFLTLRALRIFPALTIEVVLSALLIGPLLTTLSLHDYFASPIVPRYFENILGRIHYFLPGVFTTNPGGPWVNLQLWTVPYELVCYSVLSLISIIGLYKRPALFLALALASCVAAAVYNMSAGTLPPLDRRPEAIVVCLCFIFGVAIYALRTRVPFNAATFAISFALAWVCSSFPATTYLAPLPITYVTVFLGLQNPRTALQRGGDYSYALYLYGFPVQQVICDLFPAHRVWLINVVSSLAVTGLLAFLSWRFVESKVLARKKQALGFVAGLMRHAARIGTRIRLGLQTVKSWTTPTIGP
jgi:peptidoglycan/LPS O-acetylase OafA/YrhL